MNNFQLFLPCAAGVEDYLLAEVQRLQGGLRGNATKQRGGVSVSGTWADVMQLNLHSRLAQRVLLQLSYTPYRNEQDLYRATSAVAWEDWFTPRQTIKVEVTAQHSPLTSLNFAALKVKDAVCDRFREKAGGIRPNVDTRWPDMRIFAHLTTDACTLYLDTSGEPLFKRGWREDKGDAPLKETLAAAMLVASGWADLAHAVGHNAEVPPLYDPCCGSGTIAIEAAQMLCGIAPGGLRQFAFEKMRSFDTAQWQAMRMAAQQKVNLRTGLVFGSDVAHRMVDFSQRNAQRAGVAEVVEFRGGDALQRMPPSGQPGFMLLNPPYGERIAVAGISGGNGAASWAGEPSIENAERFGARELAQVEDGGEFFGQLARHWKNDYPGWTGWMLTPDLKLPSKMRMKESRRVPMWNGPIECRMFRFDIKAFTPKPAEAAATP